MRRAVLALAALVTFPRAAHAFCEAADGPAHVVIVREGTRAIVTVQCPGPADAVAVRVPAAVTPRELRAVPRAVVDAVAAAGAPAVVESWEADPCTPFVAPAGEPPVILDLAATPAKITLGAIEAQGEAQGEWTRVVARIDPATTALRFEYDADAVVVPVRGADVTVHVLAAARHDAASHPNAFAPAPSRDDAVITEHAAEVLVGEGTLVLTRLRARPGELVLREAAPVAGGGGERNAAGQLVTEAHAAGANAFRIRRAIRHPWTGPIACGSPVRERWTRAPPAEPPSPPVAKVAVTAPPPPAHPPEPAAGGCQAGHPGGGASILVMAFLLGKKRWSGGSGSSSRSG